jgi:hypothetical protein
MVRDERTPEELHEQNTTSNACSYVYSVPSVTKHSSLPHGSVT